MSASGRAGPRSAWASGILHQSVGSTCRWNVARASRPRHPRSGLSRGPAPRMPGRSVQRKRAPQAGCAVAKRAGSSPPPYGGYAAVSKFDLRAISQRLSASRDTEALVLEFLGYLESVRQDWHASLAFYEVSQDALVSVYQRSSTRLTRKDL